MKIAQETVAGRIRVSRNCIQQLECHEHLPQFPTLARFMLALGIQGQDAYHVLMILWDAMVLDIKLQDEQYEASTLV